MTIDEAIKHCEEVVEENQRVVDTGVVFDDVTIDMLYCDDTEVIEEHLANYQKCASEYRQLVEWLNDYKRLKEQEPCDDCVSREFMYKLGAKCIAVRNENDVLVAIASIESLPSVIPQQRTGQWIQKGIVGGGEYIYECSECHHTDTRSRILEVPFCWFCGARMEVEE